MMRRTAPDLPLEVGIEIESLEAVAAKEPETPTSFADEWFDSLCRELKDQGVLLGTPHRTFDGHETLLEWWNHDRKLSISITGRQVQMLWSWERGGRHFVQDVEDVTPRVAALAWAWLNRSTPTAGSQA